ncbi:MAG: lytic transglycosylase domain-containing protein [Roseomonas sp.]|nr:lytic transglycosylase domain-containing protein [Roseomonas sp.]
MRLSRRLLLSLPLLLPGTAAIAQTASSQAARITAGKAAIAAANGGRWAEAETYAAAADPMVVKIVLWMRLTHRTAPATAAELAGFLRENPDWPQVDTIARRAEAAFGGPADDPLVLAHFTTFPPRSLAGALRHAEALTRGARPQTQLGTMLDMVRRGPDNAPRPSVEAAPNLEGEAGAQQTLRRAWAEAPGDAAAEAAIMAQFGRLLRQEDHQQRFDRLFFARDMQGAQRALERLTGVALGSGRMRMALAGEPENRQVLLHPLDLAWAYERARLLRRRDQDADAVASWIVAEPFQANMDPEIARAVWAERQILARKLLRLNNAKDAHRIAAFHGQPMGSEGRLEAEFLAGFIALRFLNDPVLAQRHFVAMALGTRSVISRARALYWEGRALAARGANAAARERYAAAAQLPTAFYGQLAALTMGESQEALDQRLRALQTPPVEQRRAQEFAQRELARVVTTLAELGETRRTRVFLLRLQAVSADQQDRLLTARLANHIGRPDHAVWVARRSAIEGDILLPEGWPTPFRVPVTSPEPAFIFSVTRQESNFDTEAVSSANARGLMQLLPSTAQTVARRLGMNFRVDMLTADPQANIKLGAAYLEEMLGRFEGSLVMAAGAYNAGPRRVDEWLVTYGNPLRGERDLLDWMEMIPFAETRNYVQRIVEGAVIYRARQNPPMTAPHPMASWLASAK